MKQTARILSTYSADTFGVCSALYELGGMIVIHDPSGCNSTWASSTTSGDSSMAASTLASASWF